MSELSPKPTEFSAAAERAPFSEKYNWEKGSDINELSTVPRDMADLVIARLRPRFQNMQNWEDVENFLQQFFSEMYSNALLHGNYGEGGSKDQAEADARIQYAKDPEKYNKMPIRVRLEMDGSGFKISIEDSGQGFDASSVPDPTTPENIGRTYGRGIFLIKAFASQLGCSFDIQNLADADPPRHGTRVTLEKKLE